MAEAQTPAAGQGKKQTHWAVKFASSPIASVESRDTSYLEDPAPATLQYVNSQLVAHGFAPAPGISLDGLPPSKADGVIKTLFSLLGQRMEDMQRNEDLSTKLRTLSYDYERVKAMHKAASAAAADAEREASTLNSKLSNSAKVLSQAEAAHKQTQGELQRTRTSIQSLRSQHVAELKKRDVEHTRMAERWSKLSDSQLKAHTIPARMTMSAPALPFSAVNAQILDGEQNAFVDVALNAAESAAEQLREENTGLRQLVLDSANAVRKILHKATAADPDDFVYPAPLEAPDVFTPCATPAADGAFDKLSELLTSLRNAVTTLRSDDPRPTTSAVPGHADSSRPNTDAEVDRLQRTIEALCEELELVQNDARAHATRAEALFAQISAPQPVDNKASHDIEVQQATVDKAALDVGRDRAALETERLQFFAEKRAWELSRLLADEEKPRSTLSETKPGAFSTDVPPSPPHPPRPVRDASPHRSPRKARPHAVASRKPKLKSPQKPPARTRVTAAFETEVLPNAQQKLLRTSFALPAPSPHSRITPIAFGNEKAKQSDSEKQLTALFANAGKTAALPDAASNIAAKSKEPELTTPPFPPGPSSSNAQPSEAQSDTIFHPPVTMPLKNPFPMAKVNAPRMVHAYSPARPSPLSRILMLARSPDSLNSSASGPSKLPAAFAALDENDLLPITPDPPSSTDSGVIDEESPLRDKATTEALEVVDGKGKSRAKERVRVEEKENTIRRKLRGPTLAPRPPATKQSATSTAGLKIKKTSAISGVGVGASGARPALPAGAAKGPRRVPRSEAVG